jgi:hypothetical protein
MLHKPAKFALLVAMAVSFVGTTVQAHDPAEEMAKAANLFLKSLDKEQTAAAHFEWKDDKREGWYFVPDKFIKPAGKRFGLPLTKMNGAQKALASGLVSSALSHKGFMQVQTVMSLEQILHEMEEKNPIRNPALYYVSIFGEPSAKGTWSWRYEGHHLSINITIVKGKLLSVTPSFFGSNPAMVKEGAFKGFKALAEEEDLARELVKSLSAEQQKKAIIAAEAHKDIFTAQDRNVDKGLFTPTMGISQDELNADQQKLLNDLIKVYATKYRLEIVKQMEERKNLFTAKDVRFAWMGGTEPGEGHYYRIQTPIFLFEYDCTQNEANHVHAVWRDFDGDFGADLLRMHYEADHKE